MAKDPSQSRIPRLDGVTTRIPLPGSIRVQSQPQPAQEKITKIVRPSSLAEFRPRVSNIIPFKTSLSGEKIGEAATIMRKRTATAMMKFLTKPEKSANNIEMSSNRGNEDEMLFEKGIKESSNQKLINETGPQPGTPRPTLTRSETFVRDGAESPNIFGVTQDLLIQSTPKLNETTTNLQRTHTLDPKSPALGVTVSLDATDGLLKTHVISEERNETYDVNLTETKQSGIGDGTRTLGVADGTRTVGIGMEVDELDVKMNATEILDKTMELDMEQTIRNENKTIFYENLIDVSSPFDLDSTIKPGMTSSYRDLIDLTAGELGDTVNLAPDKGSMKLVLNSTMNTDRLLDITSTISPSRQLMNITRDLVDSPRNNTNLLYMSHQNDRERTILAPLKTRSQISLPTKTPDDAMDVDDLLFDIPNSVTQALSSNALQELKQHKPRFSFGLDLTECTLDCSIELCDVSLGSAAATSMTHAPSPSLKKQNSFEMDESLGILTPDQMKEFLDSTTTTTNNLDLPLGMHPNGSGKLSLHQMRVDQTPSPEDLPLDPVGVKTDITDVVAAVTQQQNSVTYSELSQADTESKTDQMSKSNVSKISTSFITSVTSVASLDTGYQGDGELSRPASRGAGDHSPSNGPTRKSGQVSRQPSFNQPHPIPIRRQDPMTDSDFFTESDADDVFHRGDRRAQVIDGQLYGPMLHPTASVFITEQPQAEDSAMESSGIFTDVENRGDDDLAQRRRSEPHDVDMSPDGSTDTVKSNTQHQQHHVLGTNTNNESEQTRSTTPSSLSQGHINNMLTDSQTSSTINSSMSSDRISISTDYNTNKRPLSYHDDESSTQATKAPMLQPQTSVGGGSAQSLASVKKLSPSRSHGSQSSLSSGKHENYKSKTQSKYAAATSLKGAKIVVANKSGKLKSPNSERDEREDMQLKPLKSASRVFANPPNHDNQENSNPLGSVSSRGALSATLRKISPNKWDAVMNKIAVNKSQVVKKNYNEVKSKVSTGVARRSANGGVVSGNGVNGGKSGLESVSVDGGSSVCSSGAASGLVSPQTKRIIQGATKRGRSYSKDSQRSSQSDLSLSGGSPKILAKTPSARSAKKRDVRNLSISPTDLGPPPKTQQTANGSTRSKQLSVNGSQKRTSPNLPQNVPTPIVTVKGATPVKKTASRRTAEQKTHSKAPLKDHNRLVTQQQQEKSNQQQNGTSKTNGGINNTGNNKNVCSQSNSKGGPQTPTLRNNNHIDGSPSVEDLVQKNHNNLQLCNGRLEQHTTQPPTDDTANNKGIEALGVLLQYLVYDLDAFSAPLNKIESEKAHNNLKKTLLLLEEAKTSCHQLQDQLHEKESFYTTREQELHELHRCELKKAEESLSELEANARERIFSLKSELAAKNDEQQKQFEAYRSETDVKLTRKDSELEAAKQREKELLEKIERLTTTENELRDKIQAAEDSFAAKIQSAAQRERELVEKINALNKQLDEMKKENENREAELEEKLNLTQDEVSVLRLSRSFSVGQSTSVQNSPRNSAGAAGEIQRLLNETESLRCVLELKQKDISKLTKANQELSRDAEEAAALAGKVSTLENRLEYLQTKFQIKSNEEKMLREKADDLKKALTHETTLRTRLSFDNEGLQYQLKQRSEQLHIVEAKLREHLSTSNASKSSQDLTQDLSHNSSQMSFSRTNGSDRIQFQMDDVSPPTSPIIKGVIEKHDSVSWVLEMDDETPEVAASKIVKRAGSFRSSFSEKSPGPRRQISLSSSYVAPNPLSQSASATSVIRQHSNDAAEFLGRAHSRIRSKSVSKNCEPPKVTRQNSGPSSSTRKPEIASSWKEPICSSSPYAKTSSLRCRASSKAMSPDATLSAKQLAKSFCGETENGYFHRKQSRLITCDPSALATLSSNPSIHDLKSLKGCQEIQESAGEAMVSGTNSEDETCSTSSDEMAFSSSSSASLSWDSNKHISIEEVLFVDKINNELSNTPMEVSWTEEQDRYASESVV